MKFFFLSLLTTTFLQASASQDWKARGFGPTKLEEAQIDQIYESINSEFTHEMKLTFVIFTQAGWTKKEVLKRLTRIAEVYSQCGVKVSKATLVLSGAGKTHYEILHSGMNYDLSNGYRISAQLPPDIDRPVLFYIRESVTNQENAYANPEYWVGRGNIFYDGKDSPLLNTAWITRKVTTEKYLKSRSPLYNVDAHEIGHLFTNDHHTPETMGPNLMADKIELMTDQLQPSQCETIKKSPLVVTAQ